MTSLASTTARTRDGGKQFQAVKNLATGKQNLVPASSLLEHFKSLLRWDPGPASFACHPERSRRISDYFLRGVSWRRPISAEQSEILRQAQDDSIKRAGI
jgi:hypothetical protein